MKRLTYTALSKDEGRTIKSILRQNLDISAATLTALKKYPEGISLNGESAYATAKIKEGDIIEINLKDKPSENIEPADIPLDIIYEDEDILAINKPRNMPTHPSQNHHNDTLANGVMHYFRDTDFTFRVITRLDKDTSGVVLIAKNKISAAYITREMTEGRIIKEYEAICHGALDESGKIDAPIGRVPGSSILRCVTPDGKDAHTEYELIRLMGDLSHVRLRTITGRTHQLRVHLSHIGHPIYGDDLYGSPALNEKCRLHCRKIIFTNPANGKKLILEAKPPYDMNFDN